MKISPFRKRLLNASDRLRALADRSAPSMADRMIREAVAIKEAAGMLEGEQCPCLGAVDECKRCGGTGEL